MQPSFSLWVFSDMGAEFRYLLNPTFVWCALVYIFNKFLVAPFVLRENWFFHSYLNDLLLVPVALPLLLFALRKLGIRKDDNPPNISEVCAALVVWSIFFEYVGPYYFKKGTSDVLDVTFYCVGGLVSWAIWNKQIRRFFILRVC